MLNLESMSSLDVSLTRQALQAFGRLLRPGIWPGHYRVEWICECGELLWADFETTQLNPWPSELNPAVTKVTKAPAFTKTVSNYPSSGGPDLFNFSGHLRRPRQPHSTRLYPDQPRKNTNTGRSTSSYTDRVRYRVSSTNLSRHPEIRVNTEEHNISLAEIRINSSGSPPIRSDGDLFREISN